MITAGCAHSIRYNPNKRNVNAARFAAESVRRSSLLCYSLRKSQLQHRCTGRSYITDAETPAINDSKMLISMKRLQTADASCLRTLQAALELWAGGSGQGTRWAGESRSRHPAAHVPGSDRQENRSHPASSSQTPSECLVFASEIYLSCVQVVIRQ